MWVHAEADCFWLILPPFSGSLQKFRNTDIVSFTSPRGILEPPSAVFSLCQNCYQMLVFCWHVFWQMHKFQIHKLVSRHDHLNISTMYSVIIQAGIFREYWNKCFWRTKCFGSGTSSVYGIVDIRREVQIMPFWKLSGKCHFLIQFCTRNWSETYMSCFVNLNTFLWYSQVWQSNEIRHWLSPLAIRSNNKSCLMETFLWWKVMKRFHRWFQLILESSMKSLHDHSLPFIIPISRFYKAKQHAEVYQWNFSEEEEPTKFTFSAKFCPAQFSGVLEVTLTILWNFVSRNFIGSARVCNPWKYFSSGKWNVTSLGFQKKGCHFCQV